MSTTHRYVFHNDASKRPKNPHRDSPKKPEPYIADDELIRAVNLAIFLRKPLILEGEAGCGKTRLAQAVAYELGLPLYSWYVRSTSKATDGLYRYDAIGRLHDVQVSQLANGAAKRDPNKPEQYVELEALGKAFDVKDRPAVVLIDEIDKADIDFPNDLLSVLDQWEFTIPETGEKFAVPPDKKPIVFITSNKEKGNLPAPFLRRCLYHFIEFPNDREKLEKIVASHYATGDETAPDSKLVTAAVERFLEIRTNDGLFKKPSTGELLDWLKALAAPDLPHKQVLKEGEPLPYREVLFKLRADWRNAAVPSQL